MSGQPLNRLQRHPGAANFLLLTFSTLLSLVLGEVALRIVQRAPVDNPHQLFTEYHPVLGWQKKAGFTGIHVGPEGIYRVRESLNSKGIRGPEYPYEKPPEEFRILVLGDSYAEGYTVEFDDLFSEVLKRRLQKEQRRPVQVINAGTGGYSTDQELLWFTTEGIKYRPDLTVLLFCYNDVLFNTVDRYWRGYKPAFRIDGDSLRLTNVPVPPPLPAAQQPIPPPPSVERWLYQSSYVYRALRDVISAGETSEPDYVRFADWRKATDEEKRAGWNITRALLAKLDAEARSTGSRFLLMIVPGNKEVTRGVVSICSETSINCIDPTARFWDEGLKLKQHGRKLTYAPLDEHWNAAGHGLAADVLADYILSRGYLSGP
jgi:GDSL-like lipase/acylhydrolase family protein